MNEEEVIKYWRETAQDALETAEGLFRLGRCHHSLFFAHLSLEKLLKGLVLAKTKENALPIHDLLKLSQQAGLNLTAQQRGDLLEVSTFNIAARYDNIKRAFYHKATKRFTEKWLSVVKKFYLWLENQF